MCVFLSFLFHFNAYCVWFELSFCIIVFSVPLQKCIFKLVDFFATLYFFVVKLVVMSFTFFVLHNVNYNKLG